MNHKGAIELSVNTLVVVIISLVILAGGITLLYKFIAGAEEIKADLDARTTEKLERLLVQQGKKVALPLHVADVERGKTHVFGLGILNALEAQQGFFIEIQLRKYVNELGQEVSVAPAAIEQWVLYNTGEILIEVNDNHKESILVSVPRDAAKGQYIFTALVTTTAGSYGNPQTFVVNVV